MGKKSNFVSSMSNFSIQYNLAAASIAIEVMKSHRHTVVSDSNGLTPDFPEPDWTKYTLLGVVFAGAIVGMAGMGYMGDLVGRQRAMVITVAFTTFGAAWSALASWGSPTMVYAMIVAGRFLLGVGVGGLYPLSAVKSAESSSEGEHSATRAAWAFFWQTPGSLAPYVVALPFIQLHTSWATSLHFRILLGLGAIPSAIVMIANMKEKDSQEFLAKKAANPFKEAFKHREHLRTLIGTGGTWFLYDVAYYGTAIFTPDILHSIFGSDESLLDISWQSIVVGMMGIPGAIVAIMQLKPKGGRWLSFWGFGLIALSFSGLAICYHALGDKRGAAIKFFFFCVITFAINWGPNVSTYVLPTVVFPANVRSTFHGLSAACAKLGAVAGTFVFKPIKEAAGFTGVLWCQVGLALLGMLITQLFIKDDRENAPKDVLDAESRGFLADVDYDDHEPVWDPEGVN